VTRLQVAREGNMTKLVLADKEDAHQSRHLLIGHLMKSELAEAAARNAQVQQAQGADQQQKLQQGKPAPAAAA
jgi:hypothetical protein